MTQRHAWRYIAARFDGMAKTHRESDVTWFGLCYAIRRMLQVGKITEPQYSAMWLMLRKYLRRRNIWEGDYAWPTGWEYARTRATVARKMARGQ